MIQLSDKAHQMPASPIRKLVPSADIAISKGVNVLYLNIGQPDIVSPEPAIESLHHWENPILAYTRSEGTVEYREALVTYYHDKGFTDLSIENFIVTNGGSEALIFTLSLIANPDDEVIIPEPFYANYNGFSVQTDVKVVPITAEIKDGFSLPPIAAFEEKITEKTKAIVICHPGNPTGYLYTQDELEQLKDLAIKHDLFLISDEVYREFTYDVPHHSVLALKDFEEHAIIIDSESKRFSMCGIRLGAMITRNKHVIQAGIKFAQARLSASVIAQHIAAAAHQNSLGYLANAQEKYRERRDYLIEALNKIDGVYVPQPNGAFYCVAQLPVNNTEDFAQWMLEEFEYDGNTIMVAPAAGFYATPGKGKNEVRIAYVLDVKELKKAVEILDKGLKAYQTR